MINLTPKTLSRLVTFVEDFKSNNLSQESKDFINDFVEDYESTYNIKNKDELIADECNKLNLSEIEQL